ncbi:MAG: hypothetical protein KC493_05815 [Bacteriovoracaceae bacterium]|nr:hypothetical protein [Bacteriovoracaceae bacterium]
MKINKIIVPIFILSLIFPFSGEAKTIIKVKGNKIVFLLKNLKPIGPGGVVIIQDSGVQIGKAKVKKVSRKKALAIVYEGQGLVDKGYTVKVLAPGAVGKKRLRKKKKIKYNRGKKASKKEKKEEEEEEEEEDSTYKFSFLSGVSFLKLGEPVNGRAYDPTEYGMYKGFNFELNYKWNSLFSLFLGLDYHFATGVSTLPAHSKNEATAKDLDGNLSDAFVGTHISTTDFGLKGVFFTLGYIFTSGHKLGTATNVVIRYSGSGITYGGGYEIVSDRWLYQISIRMNNYSYGQYENNTEENETISITQKSFGVNFRIGYLF